MSEVRTKSEPASANPPRAEFIEHARFHSTALHMTVAAGLAGLATHVASLLEPRLGDAGGPLPLAVVAGAACYGAVASETRARPRDLAKVVLGTAFAAVALAAVRRGALAPPWGVGLFALALGFLLARGTSGRRFWITALAGAGAVLAGRFVLGQLTGAISSPGWLVATGASAAFGLVTLLGTLPRHLQLVDVIGDSQDLLGRARAAASSEPRIRVLIEQLEQLERQGGAAPRPEVLRDRMASLESRAAGVSDELARAEYAKASAAVAEQLADVEAIGRSRERIIARLHREVEELGRSKLAATSADVDATSQAFLETE